ncbi:MAG: hypothetical protein HXY20_14375 [Acidobacteria bacterium]|nr:hypothetical protein [Acidobacteriota bacterium]
MDDELRGGLFRKRPEALAIWHRITACLEFQGKREDWQGYQPFGVLLLEK